MLAAVIVVGGSGVAVLIYLDAEGRLTNLVNTFFTYINYSANSALILCWGLVLPIILAVFAVFTLVRGRKLRRFEWSYEDSLRFAVEAERKDFVERQNKTLPSRFGALAEGKPTEDGQQVSSLAELCDRFRMFAAANLKLYFSVEDVREFVSAMGTSHMLILQGISGAGKTSLAYAFGEFLNNSSTIIPVQPMWKERADLLGYYNDFTKRYNDTLLFRKLYEANFCDRIYITVLDEMNIARIEYYFAEFLSLMELPNPDMRYLEVVSDVWDNDPIGIRNGCIKLPENMWFVGTVNNDDSAYSISDKVFDRAMVIDLESKSQPFETSEEQPAASVTAEQFNDMVTRAKHGYTLSQANADNLAALDGFLIDKFSLTFGNRIRRQIYDYVAVYVACGGTELQALDDILAKKVLRKLEYKDVQRFHGEMDEFLAFLDSVFPKDSMGRCKRYVEGVKVE